MSVLYTEQVNNFIKVDDDFAVLKEISNDGDLTFEVFFTVLKSQIIQTETLKVDIEVSTKNIRKTSPTVNGKATPAQVIQSILRNTHNLYGTALAKQNYVVANVSSDITSYIDNTKISAVQTGQKSSKNVLKNELAKNIKDKNENIPVFQKLAYKSFSDIETQISGTTVFDPALIAQQMLSTATDPASIVDLTHRSLAASDVLQGLSRKIKSQERDSDFSSHLLDFHVIGASALNIEKSTVQVQDDETQLTMQSVDDDEVLVSQIVTIPAVKDSFDIRGITQCFVSFSAPSAQKITKTLNIQNHISVFLQPREKPSLKAIRLSQKILLDIKQNDKNADSITLYKKTLYDSAPNTNPFTIIGRYSLPYGKSIKVEAELSNENTDIYRAFSTASDVTSNVFSSAVILPKNKKFNKTIPITTTNVQQGINVTLTVIPKEAITIQLLVKNSTLFEKDFTAVQNPIFIDNAARASKNISVIDTSVTKNTTYTYMIKLTTAEGRSSFTEPSVVTYKGVTSDKVSTVLSGTVVSLDPTIDVAFKLGTTVASENSDITLSLLKQAGTYDLFQADFSGSRSSLQNLLAHSVERVNKSTGLRESFGVITDGIFSDSKLQKANAVLPLELGNSYRYEVFVLMRDPETLLKNYVQTATDSRTKKQYRFSPVKFFHPVVNREGMLVSDEGLKTAYPQNEMEHGNVGLSAVYEVAFDLSNSQINSVNAIKSTRNANTISWIVTGNVKVIDHYLVMKEVHGIRTMLAAVYSPFNFVSYIHVLSHKDNGPIKYAIVAVYSDYEVATAVYSNSLVVDL